MDLNTPSKLDRDFLPLRACINESRYALLTEKKIRLQQLRSDNAKISHALRISHMH